MGLISRLIGKEKNKFQEERNQRLTTETANYRDNYDKRKLEELKQEHSRITAQSQIRTEKENLQKDIKNLQPNRFRNFGQGLAKTINTGLSKTKSGLIEAKKSGFLQGINNGNSSNKRSSKRVSKFGFTGGAFNQSSSNNYGTVSKSPFAMAGGKSPFAMAGERKSTPKQKQKPRIQLIVR